jgi:hypothetical protein
MCLNYVIWFGLLFKTMHNLAICKKSLIFADNPPIWWQSMLLWATRLDLTNKLNSGFIKEKLD